MFKTNPKMFGAHKIRPKETEHTNITVHTGTYLFLFKNVYLTILKYPGVILENFG